MGFYNLTKEERIKLVSKISNEILADVRSGKKQRIENYFSDEDTCVRKSAYQSIGKIYLSECTFRKKIITLLEGLLKSENDRIRQTVVNSAGEIGMSDFSAVENFFHKGLFDAHHSVRNAVIGSMKKMGEKNPKPVLAFAKQYLPAYKCIQVLFGSIIHLLRVNINIFRQINLTFSNVQKAVRVPLCLYLCFPAVEHIVWTWGYLPGMLRFRT